MHKPSNRKEGTCASWVLVAQRKIFASRSKLDRPNQLKIVQEPSDKHNNRINLHFLLWSVHPFTRHFQCFHYLVLNIRMICFILIAQSTKKNNYKRTWLFLLELPLLVGKMSRGFALGYCLYLWKFLNLSSWVDKFLCCISGTTVEGIQNSKKNPKLALTHKFYSNTYSVFHDLIGHSQHYFALTMYFYILFEQW